jgi:hypothetical protein
MVANRQKIKSDKGRRRMVMSAILFGISAAGACRIFAETVISEKFEKEQSGGFYGALMKDSHLSVVAGKGTNGSKALRAKYVGNSQ